MAKEQLTETDVDMLESLMAMTIVGNVEDFNGAPYIARLTDKLKEKNIPFKLGKIYNHGDAVTFPWSDGDVICHHGSYGHKQGFYEFMGDDFLTPEEASRDSVKGNIPLEDAVSRIEKAYKKYKDRHRPGYYREYNLKHPERIARLFGDEDVHPNSCEGLGQWCD